MRSKKARAPKQTSIVKPVRRVAALLGFLHKAEVDAIFKEQPFETRDGADPLELWRQYNAKIGTLQPLVTIPAEPLPRSLSSLIDEIKTRRTYKKYYEAIADYSFQLVPVDSLLAPQWYSDLDYVDELISQLSKTMSLGDQLNFAMSEGRITEPIIIGNQVLFTSPRRNLSADQIPTVKELEGGEFEISIKAASRPNYIQVAVLNGRLFLTNGVHKVCALYKMGFTRVPCVVRTVHSLEETGIARGSISLFSSHIFEGPRPALVKDFLDPNVAVPINMRSTYQILQVTVSSGATTVPALPTERPSSQQS